jgi:flavin reductase (DIM6/NTAB) family NADH-FMN oxidoreductase RutF/3,4-dihydroxy-2-butanone 4-phosphate synthase
MPESMEYVTNAPAERAPIDADLFRAVFGGVPAAVSVVTTALSGRPHGATVSAFCSLSLDPPLVLVSLHRESALLQAIRRTRRFCVNVLAAGQEDLALRFARRSKDKFEGLLWLDRHELPVLPGSQSWVAAAVQRVFRTGDHMTLIGLVFDAAVNDATPLLYHARRFDELAGLPRGRPRPEGGHTPPVGTRGVEYGIRELGTGRPVLVFDPVRQRTDIVAVSDGVALEVVELMADRGSGLNAAVTEARARQLWLVREPSGTVVATAAAGAPVAEAAAATYAVLADPKSEPDDLTAPGIVSLLVGRTGGLLECIGRAEAALDAVRLSGAAPVAAVSEVVGADGGPLAWSGVVGLARELDAPVVDLDELAQTRRELEWSLW